MIIQQKSRELKRYLNLHTQNYPFYIHKKHEHVEFSESFLYKLPKFLNCDMIKPSEEKKKDLPKVLSFTQGIKQTDIPSSKQVQLLRTSLRLKRHDYKKKPKSTGMTACAFWFFMGCCIEKREWQ